MLISDQLRDAIHRYLGPKIRVQTGHGGFIEKYRDHSLEDLANASGCLSPQISKFMSGKCNLSMEKIDKLCEFLKLKLDNMAVGINLMD